MKKLVFLIVLFFVGNLFAQNPEIVLVIKALDEETNKNLPGVNVIITQDGKPYKTLTTNSKGKVPLVYVPVGHMYTIKFKKDGYVTKMAQLDGRYDTPEDLDFETSRDMKFYLFKSVEGVDFSFLENEPMVKFEFSPDGYEFVWDIAYSNQMQKKIKDLKKQMEDKAAENEEKEKEKAKQEADFQAYVKAGDAAVAQKDYQKAIGQYDLALAIKDDAVVKSKKEAAQKALDELAKLEQIEKDYQAKISEAKSAFDAKKYQDAINLYKEASNLKPNEQKPKDEIAKIQALLAQEKAKKEEFDQLVADGDNAVNSKNYDVAIEKYTKALALFDDNTVKTKLNNAKTLKAELENQAKAEAEKKAKFDALVKTADNAFTQKDYNAAKEKYLEAQTYFPNDNHVKSQLAEVEKKIEEEKAKEAEAKAKEEQYLAKMAEAKSAFDSKNYENALKLYQEAAQLKTTADEPKAKIQEINNLIKQQAEREKEFNNLVQEGDAALANELFDDAIAKYTKALDIKNEPAVQNKKAEAERLKQEKIEAENKAKSIEKDYKAAIDAADKAFDNDDWETAKIKYNEALKIKENEEHPKIRLKEIEQKIAEQKAKEAEEQAKLKAYNDLISEADQLLTADKLEEAKAKYVQASKIFPDESKPKNKIDEINNLLTNRAEKAAKDAEYQAAMDKGNKLYTEKKYEEALKEYNRALGIYDKQEPKDKINEINTLLANQKSEAQREADYQKKMKEGNDLLANGDLTTSLSAFKEALALKPGDISAQSKIDEVEAKIKAKQEASQLEKDFNDLVAKGNTAFDAKDYQTAKSNYLKALDLKEDAALRTKIKTIDDLIAKTQQDAEFQATFDKLIKDADDFYSANAYEKALAKYKEAESLKSTQHAKERILDIEQKIADAKAKEALDKKYNDLITKAKSEESSENWQQAIDVYKQAYDLKQTPEINQKIGELQTKLLELNQNKSKQQAYQEKIQMADAKFKANDWQQAIEYYQQAKTFDPSQTYPDEQIALAQQNINNEKLAEKEANYNKIIQQADAYFKNNDLDQAADYYNKAIGIKPNDNYPKEQLAEIQKIKDERSSQLNEAQRKEQAYKDLVASADRFYDAKNYKTALEKYLEAQTLKSDDRYVIEQIEKTKSALSNQSVESQKRAQYEALIAEADALFNTGKWKDAKIKYEAALGVISTEAYPKTQIDICVEQMKKETGSEVNEAYQKLIDKAQEYFDTKNYTKALSLYERAKAMNPTDPLPPNKIAEINQIIKENKGKSAYESLIQQADNLFEQQEWKKARPLYQKALKLKKEQYPKDQIAKIDAKLGGFEKEQYDKMISKADEYFTKGNYEKAKNLYNRAITFQPNWDNTYPKEQLVKIRGILNPPKAINNELRNLGEPVVGVSEEEMEKLLMTDEEQQHFNSSNKVVEYKEEIMSYEHDWDKKEEQATIKAKETTNQIESDTRKIAWEGEIEREKAVQATTEQTDENNEVNREIVIYNEHVMYRQKEVITAITDEISEVEYNAELERQAYEAEVTKINTEIATQDALNANSQTNDVFNTKTYVENEKEKHVTQDPNMDVSRKNMEVRVIDMKIENANKTTKDEWKQTDYVYQTKENVDVMKDEQTAYMVGADLDRQAMEDKVVEIEEANVAYSTKISNKQADISFETKKYTDHIQDEIVINNMANDVPRQKMEVKKVEITDEINKAQFNDIANQNADINDTKDYVNQEIDKQTEIYYNKEKQRQGYEEEVVKIESEIKTTQKVLADDNVNKSFNTKDYVEKEKVITQQMKNEGEVSTIENQEKVNQTTEELKEKQINDSEKSQEKVNDTEDYLTGMKDKFDDKKETVYTPNELGKKYPEGVTEEIYQDKDANGLLQSYTVRRIIVVEGQGFVYEKTKTRYGTTYTKNGVGITESKWNEETNNAGLVRN